MATRAVAWGSGTETIRYQHTDALGSPVAETDIGGSVTKRNTYAPYGEAYGATNIDGTGYTGHVMDRATGLTYMQQRYYDPVIGRFLSVDPVSADPNSGVNFNRYWYGNNNPYKFTDPDGRSGAPAFALPYGVNDVVKVRNPEEAKKFSAGLIPYAPSRSERAASFDKISISATTGALAMIALGQPEGAVPLGFIANGAAATAFVLDPNLERAVSVATFGLFKFAGELVKDIKVAKEALEVGETLNDMKSVADSIPTDDRSKKSESKGFDGVKVIRVDSKVESDKLRRADR